MIGKLCYVVHTDAGSDAEKKELQLGNELAVVPLFHQRTQLQLSGPAGSDLMIAVQFVTAIPPVQAKETPGTVTV